MPIATLCLTLAAGCSSDDAVETPTATTKPFTINASLGAGNAKVGSRATVDYGTVDQAKETFKWNASDKFTVIAKDANGQNVPNNDASSIFHTFTIDENYKDNASSNSASFSCSTFQPSAGTISMFAYYPADGAFTATNDNKEYTYSVATQTQTGANTDHLKQKMLMYATSSFTSPAAASLTFKHLTAMLRFTVTNENSASCKVTAITVTSSANNVFGTSGKITPAADDYSQDPTIGTTAKAASLTLNMSDYELAAAGTTNDKTTVNGYMLTLPGDALTDQTLTFSLAVKDAEGNSRTYTSFALAANDILNNENNTSDTTWKAGKRYWFNLTLDDKLTVTLNLVDKLPGWDNDTETEL